MAESVLASYGHRWNAAAARRMTVLHADFGLDHWLLDTHGPVYALIDWSDACIAPPEHQLSTLMWDIPDVAGVAAASYEERTGDHLDLDLIFADGYVAALGDLAALLGEGRPEDDTDVQRCVNFLEQWRDQRIA